MAAEIGTAHPCLSQHRRETSSEWLIVARWGRDGEYLTLSRTGIARDGMACSGMTRDGMSRGAGTVAPINLAPTRTCIGVLTPDTDDDRAGGPHAGPHGAPRGVRGGAPRGGSICDLFTLTRHLPQGIIVAGVFAPADGFIRLRGPVEAMHLTAAARDAGGQVMAVAGRSGTPPAERGACAGVVSTWNIRACRRPWDGEFIEPVDLMTC